MVAGGLCVEVIWVGLLVLAGMKLVEAIGWAGCLIAAAIVYGATRLVNDRRNRFSEDSVSTLGGAEGNHEPRSRV
ncbi:MAG: hypothetical protein ACR2MY_13730 [Candidatus Dormibacteria bacterium]